MGTEMTYLELKGTHTAKGFNWILWLFFIVRSVVSDSSSIHASERLLYQWFGYGISNTKTTAETHISRPPLIIYCVQTNRRLHRRNNRRCCAAGTILTGALPITAHPWGLCVGSRLCKDAASSKAFQWKDSLLCDYFSAAAHLQQIGSQLAAFALKLFTSQPLKPLWVRIPSLQDVLQLQVLAKYSNWQAGTAVGPKNMQGCRVPCCPGGGGDTQTDSVTFNICFLVKFSCEK